ncbi:ATP-dependent RNA helicase p62-like [Plodia interpunctella]|uniref:ATP-dependent RNA helicase p62-like n=1 Tax=Plodia interpunctella TaxID=58824 RepID=UPI0023685A53|nr:ATP-dependent RNA helicase p62-like [Plodia interpunctella]
MASNFVRTLLKRNDLCKLLHQSKQIAGEANFIRTLLLTRNVHSTITKQIFHNHTQLRLLSTQYRAYSTKTAEQQDIDNYRIENKITIIGQDIPSPYTDIENSEFPDYIKNFLKKQGFEKPTVIQSQAWPIALNGQNFVGIAQTGTGKTLAFLLPAVVHIKEKEARKGLGPRVLVLAPTRELARQIEHVTKDFGKLLNIRCACIYGGASRAVQADILKAGVDIVIATPGRLNDFLVSKTTTLSRCTYVVLDEADRMLDMGFEPQIRQALEGVPLERQILMFSATWPKEVQYLAKDYLGEYVQVNVGSTELSANHNIAQHIHICHQEEKLEKFKSIMHSIAADGFGKLLVFTNTKKFVDTLSLMLKRNGWPSAGIHGDRTQLQRDTIINRFKSGQTNILVATDVAARGLDVGGITHVINYDFPNTSEDYIHRIGRTGRQQNKGVAHTILTDEDARQAHSLIAVLKEANQEVPQELINLARSFNLSKAKEHQFKKGNSFRPNSYNWGPNKRFNKFRSNSMDRSNFRKERY